MLAASGCGLRLNVERDSVSEGIYRFSLSPQNMTERMEKTLQSEGKKG